MRSAHRTIGGMIASGAIMGACARGPSAAPTPATGGVQFTRANIGRLVDSMVNDRQFRSATWGILIVDPETRDTLYSHNAAKLLIPASNQKLVVSSTILE